MNYYNEIKDQLIKSEIYDRAKDYSKDRHKVKVYFEIGRLLNEAGKEYGKNVIKQYAEKLIVEVGKKYNERTLYGMRKFFEVFSNEKLNPLGSKLSWSHYNENYNSNVIYKSINRIKFIKNNVNILIYRA
mgnify:CR=1 FL=1